MNSEKVKEIKKALEHCGEKLTCQGCPEYNNEPVIDWFKCKKNLSQKTINLINELEREKNELKRYKRDWLNSEKMHLQADLEDTEFELNSANNSLKEVREENQQLKDRIAELEKENEIKTDTIVGLLEKQEFYENEKLKQFAERLKEKYGKSCSEYYPLLLELTSEQLDETLKEFIDD